MNSDIRDNLLKELDSLSNDQQAQVLDFARSLRQPKRIGVPGKSLLSSPGQSLRRIVKQ